LGKVLHSITYCHKNHQLRTTKTTIFIAQPESVPWKKKTWKNEILLRCHGQELKNRLTRKHSKTSILTIFHISPMTIWELTQKAILYLTWCVSNLFSSWCFFIICVALSCCLNGFLMSWCAEALMLKGQPLRICVCFPWVGQLNSKWGKSQFFHITWTPNWFKTPNCTLKKGFAAFVPLLSNS